MTDAEARIDRLEDIQAIERAGDALPAAGSAADPYAAAAGARIVDAGPDGVRLELTVEHRHLNDRGIAHGGALFTLADVAASIAANLSPPPAVISSATLHFVRPARAGDVLVATAKTHHQGRTIGVHDVEISRDGQLVATMRAQSFAVDDKQVNLALEDEEVSVRERG
jgi:acyl-CoA thioesterase